MPNKDEYEEDDEEDENDPLNIFKMFKDSDIFKDPNNLFNNFDPSKILESDEFKDIFKNLFKQVLHNMPEEYQDMSPEDLFKELTKSAPHSAFFKFGFDRDGKPIMQPFGKPTKGIKRKKPITPKVKDTREPLVEVSEVEGQIIIIAEMPGVKKEDIEIKSTNYSLTISTKPQTESRSYYKEIDLPTAINSDYAKARYMNGILEIKLKKYDEEKQNKIEID
ncbi:MAG: Hsp20/alpha crystallin family protein [Promethearchaeota archaeon]